MQMQVQHQHFWFPKAYLQDFAHASKQVFVFGSISSSVVLVPARVAPLQGSLV